MNNRILSCAHRGTEADLKLDIASDGHSALAKEQAMKPAITSFLRQPSLTYKIWMRMGICVTLCIWQVLTFSYSVVFRFIFTLGHSS